MSITVSAAHPNPDGFEGRGDVPGPDRFEVRERDRATKQVAAVHERFGTDFGAHDYAATRAQAEPNLYGPAAAHELVVVDTKPWWHR